MSKAATAPAVALEEPPVPTVCAFPDVTAEAPTNPPPARARYAVAVGGVRPAGDLNRPGSAVGLGKYAAACGNGADIGHGRRRDSRC